MAAKTITLKEVAQRAGVSRSAVSRTFTEGASVSAKTRDKVLEAADALGYRPNFLARSLTTRRTKLIGLVSDNFHNPFFLAVFDQFTRGLQERGLRPLLVNLSDETDPQNSVQLLRQYSVDGVIVASSTLPPSFAKAFRDAGVVVVHAFGRDAARPYVHVVGVDNVACGRMAARCLIDRGYTQIGFMGGPQTATSSQDRMAGFVLECKSHLQVDYSCSNANGYSFDAGRAEMQRLIEQGPAQAYFCGDDVLSIGAISAAQSAGLDVPRDLGVIGLNDMEMAGWENINLTTIRQPIGRIVEASITLMESSLDTPDYQPKSKMFPCKIIERGTLRPI